MWVTVHALKKKKKNKKAEMQTQNVLRFSYPNRTLVLLASLSSMLICLCVCMLHKFKLLLLKDFLTYIEYSHFLNFLLHNSCGRGGVSGFYTTGLGT